MVKTWWSVVKDSLSEASIRGLPKTIQPRHCCCRIIWGLVVTLLIVAAIINAHRVIKDYCSNPVVSVLQEFVFYHNPEETKKHVKINFPSVTVCNTRPFANNYSRRFDNDLSYDEYLYKVAIEGSMIDIPAELLSPYGYFSYLGVDEAEKRGKPFWDFVISCEVLFKLYFVHEPCDQYVYRRRLANPYYFDCFLLEVNTSALNYDNLPQGFVLTLYIGSAEDQLPNPLESGYEGKNWDSGIVLTVQAPGKHPNLFREANHLAPGFHHRINIGTESRDRLPSPYTDPGCVETDPEALLHQDDTEWRFIDLNGNKLGYSRLAEIMACMNDDIHNECKCMDPDIPVRGLFYPHTNAFFCGSIREGGVQGATERLTCMNRIKSNAAVKCGSQSNVECKDTMLTCDISAYKWPRELEQVNFYRNYIKNKTYQSFFQEYDDIDKLIQSGQNKEAVKRLRSTNLITENFLRVTLINKDLVAPMTVDKPKYTMATFLSQLGGALNLWAGITLVCLFEILELLQNLVCLYIQKRRGMLILDD